MAPPSSSSPSARPTADRLTWPLALFFFLAFLGGVATARLALALGQSSVVALLLVAMGAVLALLLARLIATRLLRPLRALAATAHAMTREPHRRAPGQAAEELGVMAGALNHMAGELETLHASQEGRVVRRIAQLETAAEVTSAASAVRDLSTLLDLTVGLIVERFDDIYHAQVFLLDQRGAGEWAVLRASTGEPGRQLLEQQHRLQVGSRSVIGQVSATGNFVLARPGDPSSVHRPNPFLPETKTELALPMKREGHVIGALDVQSRNDVAFTPGEIQVLQTLADQLAIAVENARLFQDLQATVEQLATAAEVSRAASMRLNVDVILERAVTLIRERFEDIYHAQVFLLDEQNKWALLTASTGEIGKQLLARQHRLAVGSVSVIGQVTSQGTPVIARSTDVDPGTVHRRNELLPQTRTELALPMMIGERIIGALDVQSTSASALQDENDVRVLQTLANQLAVAVQNARLFQQTEERNHRLAALSTLSAKLLMSTTVDELIRIAAREITTIMAVDQSGVAFFDWPRGMARVVAQHRRDEQPPHGIGVEFPIAGTASIDWVMQHRRPLAVTDVQSDETLSSVRDILAEEGVKSILILPLFMRGELIGTIGLDVLEQPRLWSDVDLSIASTISTLLASAIESTRLFEQLQQTLEQTQELYRTSAAINEASRADELLHALLRVAAPLDPDQIALLLFEQPLAEQAQAERFQVAASIATRAEMLPVGRYSADTLPLLQQPLTGQPLLIEDASSAPTLSDAERHALEALGIGSLCYLPLRVAGRYLGWVAFHAAGPRAFPDPLILRLRSLVQQVAAALQSQQLLHDAQRQAWQEEQVARITARLYASTDPAEIMRVGLTELQQTLKLKRAAAWIDKVDHPHRNGSNGSHPSATPTHTQVAPDS